MKNLMYAVLATLFFSCQEAPKKSAPDETSQQTAAPNFENKAHELVYKMVQQVGPYAKLRALKDVTYTYRYTTPDSLTDISQEKYRFDGELSYGHYKKHQRTLPDLEGTFEQGYDGETFWVKHQGELLQDEQAIQRAVFNRKTNFYWFAMMQKLLDPGLQYTYVGQDTVAGTEYDIVKITFDSPDNTPKDIYQVYINQETHLVDQFLFTVVDFNRTEPMLMRVAYEEVSGILIPAKRKYIASNWEAEPMGDNWIHVDWEDIQFNNGFEVADFKP